MSVRTTSEHLRLGSSIPCSSAPPPGSPNIRLSKPAFCWHCRAYMRPRAVRNHSRIRPDGYACGVTLTGVSKWPGASSSPAAARRALFGRPNFFEKNQPRSRTSLLSSETVSSARTESPDPRVRRSRCRPFNSQHPDQMERLGTARFLKKLDERAPCRRSFSVPTSSIGPGLIGQGWQNGLTKSSSRSPVNPNPSRCATLMCELHVGGGTSWASTTILLSPGRP